MFVITGGGSGIGRALARTLAERKQNVLIIGRRKAALKETASVSPYIKTLSADITSSKGQEAIIKELSTERTLLGLIHCAGIIEPISKLKELEVTDWRIMLETALTSYFLLTKKLHEKLHNGRILHIGAYFEDAPETALAPYCIFKHAASFLTACWQLESSTIACTNARPGFVDTEMQTIVRESKYITPELRKYLKQLKNNNQLITPETTACFLTWLLLDIDRKRFCSQDWDIYDTSHHAEWLSSPHRVPILKK